MLSVNIAVDRDASPYIHIGLPWSVTGAVIMKARSDGVRSVGVTFQLLPAPRREGYLQGGERSSATCFSCAAVKVLCKGSLIRITGD